MVESEIELGNGLINLKLDAKQIVIFAFIPKKVCFL